VHAGEIKRQHAVATVTLILRAAGMDVE
jgi:hypothetical protein